MVVWGWFGERPSLAFFFKIGPASFFFFHIPPRTPHTRPRGPAGEWGNVGCFNFTLLYAHDIPPKTQKYQKHTICLRKRKKSGGGMYSPTERFPPPLSPRWGNVFPHGFPHRFPAGGGMHSPRDFPGSRLAKYTLTHDRPPFQLRCQCTLQSPDHFIPPRAKLKL